jgi:hypothetical protein
MWLDFEHVNSLAIAQTLGNGGHKIPVVIGITLRHGRSLNARKSARPARKP